jgi:predicted phosphodiesterase
VPDLRRIALLGDLHAEDERLALALTWLKGQAIGAIVSVGDLADGHGDLDRCCDMLQGHGVLAVRGNHDRWLLADELRTLSRAHRRPDLRAPTLAFLSALPPTRRLATVRGDLLVCHGVGDDDMIRLRPDDDGYALDSNFALTALLADRSLRLVVGGHTHRRMVRRFTRPGGPPLVFVNPGTLHRDYESGFAVLDLDRAAVEFIDMVEGPGTITPLPAETLPLGA